ncbi:SGNH/GDSL hydrolase family protein [Novosphingobium album (ex Hu et al. 2023)]|uniref:SGNH/GDSL hydrolase family protein n=1 Tax=Novosphingobium album (ex Hu et al. 2023) TaxID=2930093 RepID=A0ABT0B3I6_9SPHN|nr:SGNH/GDSL hydrolase family protein [Novosphingobium album (ex Hu et al. 2023)]MCJ2179605.1 SGNH/GDSL hydrolase family protein [Novosphingobium album (ex Hu et al. 2023)]
MKTFFVSASASTALLLGFGTALTAVAKEADIAEAAATVEQGLEGAKYVAMGSSYAAGPLLPPGKPGAPARCGQSLNNYPTLLAERFGMVLIDRSCSGATTNHILGPWGDIAPQVDGITPDTRLVTVTIGGNDLNYVGNLFNATCDFNAKTLAASGAKPKPCAPVKVPTEADYARDEAQLNEIARRVRAAAPEARLVFVQYLAPLPPAGSLCAVTPVSEENATIIREIGRRLAEITGRVALTNGALVVEMNQASATHTPCDPEPWMIGSPQGYDGKQGLQWHLNKAGMQATADGIAYWLIQAGITPGIPVTPVPNTTTPEPTAPEPTPAPEEGMAPVVIPEADAP